MISLFGWTALVLAMLSTVLLGRKSIWGWALSALSCTLWILTNLELGFWPGVVSSVAGIALAYWNWRRWRAES